MNRPPGHLLLGKLPNNCIMLPPASMCSPQPYSSGRQATAGFEDNNGDSPVSPPALCLLPKRQLTHCPPSAAGLQVFAVIHMPFDLAFALLPGVAVRKMMGGPTPAAAAGSAPGPGGTGLSLEQKKKLLW